MIFIYAKVASSGNKVENIFFWKNMECCPLSWACTCWPIWTNADRVTWCESVTQYFLLFSNYNSHMSWAYFFNFKLDEFENFKKFKALMEKETGWNIKALHTDRGGKFLSNYFNLFFFKKMEFAGILQHILATTKWIHSEKESYSGWDGQKLT